MAESTGYPVSVSIEYPETPLDRLKTGFRLVLLIPIVIVYSFQSPGQRGGAAGIIKRNL